MEGWDEWGCDSDPSTHRAAAAAASHSSTDRMRPFDLLPLLPLLQYYSSLAAATNSPYIVQRRLSNHTALRLSLSHPSSSSSYFTAILQTGYCCASCLFASPHLRVYRTFLDVALVTVFTVIPFSSLLSLCAAFQLLTASHASASEAAHPLDVETHLQRLCSTVYSQHIASSLATPLQCSPACPSLALRRLLDRCARLLVDRRLLSHASQSRSSTTRRQWSEPE